MMYKKGIPAPGADLKGVMGGVGGKRSDRRPKADEGNAVFTEREISASGRCANLQ